MPTGSRGGTPLSQDSPAAGGTIAGMVANMGMSEVPGPEAEGDLQLLPCPHCPRRFNEKALAKHVPICVKVFQKQRKAFNSKEQMLGENYREAVQVAKQSERKGKGTGKGAQPEDGKVASNWKAKSEALRDQMKEARLVAKFKREGRSLADLPPPKPTNEALDDRIPCPHCGRKFAQQAAERHIPKCADTKAKPGGILKAGAAQGGRAPPRPKPKAKGR